MAHSAPSTSLLQSGATDALEAGLARVAIAVPVFYFVAAGQWQRVAAALLGFVLARSLLILRWRPIPFNRAYFSG